MPVYNRAHLLPETLSYLFTQTFGDFELLVFDDGSSDHTLDVLNAIDDPRLRVIGSERRGPPHPLNALYDAARGEHLIVLHDHDLFEPDLLEASVAALEAHPEAALVLQGSADVGLDGCSGYRTHPKPWPPLNDGSERLAAVLMADKAFASPFHACCMVRRSALPAQGPWYDAAFGLHADVDLWFRLLRGRKFVYLPEILFRFRAREPRGHILEGKDFEVVDTMRDIFLKNGRILFSDDAERLTALKHHIAVVHAKLQRRLATRALLRRPRLLPQALQRLRWARGRRVSGSTEN
jgi:glycosyltransferase involved in cell wall biosynthesis